MRNKAFVSIVLAASLLSMPAIAAEDSYQGVRMGGTFHEPAIPVRDAAAERRRIDRLIPINGKPVYVEYNRELDRAVRGTPSVEKYLAMGYRVGDYAGGYPVRAKPVPLDYWDVPGGIRWNP